MQWRARGACKGCTRQNQSLALSLARQAASSRLHSLLWSSFVSPKPELARRLLKASRRGESLTATRRGCGLLSCPRSSFFSHSLAALVERHAQIPTGVWCCVAVSVCVCVCSPLLPFQAFSLSYMCALKLPPDHLALLYVGRHAAAAAAGHSSACAAPTTTTTTTAAARKPCRGGHAINRQQWQFSREYAAR